jgi:hypothetical protein
MSIVKLKDELEPYYDNLDHIVNDIVQPKVRGDQFKLFDACRFKIKSIWYIQKRIEELDNQYKDSLLSCIAENALAELSLTQNKDWGAEYFFYFPFFEATEFENLLTQGKACLDSFAKAIGSIYSPGGLPKNLKGLIRILESKSGDLKVDKIIEFIRHEHKLRGVVIEPLRREQKSLRDLVIHYGRADIFFSIRRDKEGKYNLSQGALVNMKNPHIAKLPNYNVTEIAAKVWFLLLGIIENCFKIQFEDNAKEGDLSMINDDYHKQRLEGVRLINKEINEMAKKYDIKDIEIEWDRGLQIVDREFHILKISNGRITVEGKFPDESLADFPGKVGTASTKGIIKKMLLDFSKKLNRSRNQ